MIHRADFDTFNTPPDLSHDDNFRGPTAHRLI
jgi:hypothetical protein